MKLNVDRFVEMLDDNGKFVGWVQTKPDIMEIRNEISGHYIDVPLPEFSKALDEIAEVEPPAVASELAVVARELDGLVAYVETPSAQGRVRSIAMQLSGIARRLTTKPIGQGAPGVRLSR